jgi:hypothetical protein
MNLATSPRVLEGAQAVALFFPQQIGQVLGEPRRYGFASVQVPGNLPLYRLDVRAVLRFPAHERPPNDLSIPIGNPVSAPPPLMG